MHAYKRHAYKIAYRRYTPIRMHAYKRHAYKMAYKKGTPIG